MQVVNAAIWDGTTERVPAYRARGVEAYQLCTGKKLDPRTVTLHADHVEASWHEVTADHPERYDEVPVFPSDYESLVDTAADLSARAMSKLTGRLDQMTSTELIQAAKVGVTARGQQRATEVAAKTPKIELTAIFGMASGHISSTNLPESEAIDVTPEKDLLDAVHAERRQLEAHARS